MHSHASRFSLVSVALVSAVVGLAPGCMTIGPDYLAPGPNAPSAWHAPLPHQASDTALLQWWDQFNDPVLGRLIVLAQSDSPTLARAWANIEKARAALQATDAGSRPSISASATTIRSRQLADTATSTATSRSAGLDASWELDLFGKVRRGAEASRARVEARVNDWHDARVSLAAEVADTYVQYRACGLLSDAYERELASMVDTDKATAQLVKAGFSPPADAALARAGLASAKSALYAQRAECELLVKSLVSLTGTDEPSLRALLGSHAGGVPQPVGLKVQSIPADVLRQRPDLASLERELAAASADIGVARADLYPSLSLAGSVGIAAISSVSSATTWSFGPSLSLPLFDGGRRRAAVSSARAGYAAALANYRQGVRNVVKEVEQALVNLDATGQRTDEAERAAEEYRRYFEATELNWRAGGVSLLTLEEARRAALSAQVQRLTLQRDRVGHWIGLYKALGGGWQTGQLAVSPQALAASAAARGGKGTP